MDSGLQRTLRIVAGVLGLLLSLPLAIAAYGVSVFISSDAGSDAGITTPVLAVTIGVALVALVLFVCSIRTLVRAYATRLTLFLVAGCELVALALFLFAMRNGSNLVLYAVIAAVGAVASVFSALGIAPRRATA